jgi:hypothetical protein
MEDWNDGILEGGKALGRKFGYHRLRDKAGDKHGDRPDRAVRHFDPYT